MKDFHAAMSGHGRLSPGFHLTTEQLASALSAKPIGRGRWKARCVAHEDHHPSLVITQAESGKTLVKCWSGCNQDEVIAALRGRGLWAPMSAHELAQHAPRQKRKDDRELQWMLDDIQLLDAEPEAASVWEFVRHAAELSPFALECTSRVLRRERSSCGLLVRQWLDRFMQPSQAQDVEQVA